MKKLVALMIMVVLILSASVVPAFAAEPGWFWDLGSAEQGADEGLTIPTVSTIKVEDEYVTLTDKSGDGYIYPGTSSAGAHAGDITSAGLDPIDCNTLKVVVAKMRIVTPAENMKLQILIKGGAASVTGTVDAENTDWQYVIADGSSLEKWVDEVKWFRIDPVNAIGAVVDVDWVAMFKTVEEAQAYISAGEGDTDNDADTDTDTDKDTNTDTDKDETKPQEPNKNPNSGDVSVVFLVVIAALALTVVAKKKIFA